MLNEILDLVNIFDKIKSGSPLSPKIGKKMGSIARNAAASTYYYEALVSNDIEPSTAGMTIEALQYKYCYFVEAGFALMPVIRVRKNGPDIEGYLAMFHQNAFAKGNRSTIYVESAMLKIDMLPWDYATGLSLNEATHILEKEFGIMTEAIDMEINPQGIKDSAKALGDRVRESRRIAQPEDIIPDQAVREFGDKDYTKFTALAPSKVIAKLQFAGGQVATPKPIEIPVGVKVNAHPVSNDQLVESLAYVLSGRGRLHQLTRVLSGELKTIKDMFFTFNVKRAATGDNEVDQFLATYDKQSKIRSLSLPAITKKSFIPTGTTIVSMHVVNRLKNEFNINLLDANVAIQFLTKTKQLGFVVVDELNEQLYEIYDNHSRYTAYPFATVKRDNNAESKNMENLIKALASKGTF